MFKSGNGDSTRNSANDKSNFRHQDISQRQGLFRKILAALIKCTFYAKDGSMYPAFCTPVKFDFQMITETGLNNCSQDNILTSPGYKSFKKNRERAWT